MISYDSCELCVASKQMISVYDGKNSKCLSFCAGCMTQYIESQKGTGEFNLNVCGNEQACLGVSLIQFIRVND